jgi:hypothetical protein
MRDLSDCLPYVKHLRMEHRRLNEVLRQISGIFVPPASLRQSSIRVQLMNSLTELRADLSHHFAEEESGGCMEEAVSRCPGLSPDVKKVEAEHAMLLEKLDCVLQRAASLQLEAARVTVLQQEFQSFAELLKHHEAAENRILQMGFGASGECEE